MVFLALAPLLLLAPSASAAQAGSDPDSLRIPPVVWQLAGVAEADGAPVTIDDPARYTVQFLPEGRLLARFDCNQGSGGYTAAEGVLTLTPLAVTTALCPPDSRRCDLPAPTGAGHRLPVRPGGGASRAARGGRGARPAAGR